MRLNIRYRLIQIVEFLLWLGAAAGLGQIASRLWNMRDQGWRACSLGNMLPFATLRAALCDTQPRLFWLSIASIQDEATFYDEFERLSQLASERRAALVVGGKALTEDVRKRMHYSAYCDTFEHLADFARTVRPRGETSHE